MAKKQWLALEILTIVYVTSAAPVEPESGGISNIFGEQMPNDDYLSTSYKNVDDYETYRKKKAEQGFTSLCWTESLIITEDKRSKAKNMSKAYSIILESMANPEKSIGENKNTSCYKIEGDDDIKRERIFNFTTVKETDVYSVKEHKTLFCGAGPVLSEHFIVWPKLNRKRIEISISPMTSTKWRACEENTVGDSDRLGNAVSIEDSSVLDNSGEENMGSKNVIDEPLMDSTYDNSSIFNMAEPSSVGMSQNIDDSVSKSAVDTENPPTGSKETTVNVTANRTNHSDWTESETVHSWKGKENSRNGSKSIQLSNDTIVKNLTKEVSETEQLKVTQNTKNNDVGKSVDTRDLPVGTERKSKATKNDRVKKEKMPSASTTGNSVKIGDIQKKKALELSNSLLNQNSNCTSRNSSICNEIITKSSLIAEFQNTSSATLANLFFPNNTLLHIFRFADNHSYYLNAKVVLELKMSDSNSKIEDEKGAYLVLEEESKYLIQKHRD